MDLDQQLSVLLEEAPQDGSTPAAIAAIAPLLKQIALQLRHREYYIRQSLDQQWMLTELVQRGQTETTKTVIYAFPSLNDAASGAKGAQDPRLMALPVPVTHILFQMLALEGVDSIIFVETPGDPNSGVEVQRSILQALVREQLIQLSSPPIPPDIA
ncbi:hypothetical protein [Geitlerinema sp. PCC 7407]|uniref:hypothetical protein n=1 Tax=Geitlerinema sp. PCC 7407 TaxID=1173025 RepID=UPI00029F81E0|nr:hypothetical protein [Geitlerinema sp. PCC 7407]AFY65411.1 hypothetical protein GEI7407_0913 [Geitlerinema sp. PCC 7407]